MIKVLPYQDQIDAINIAIQNQAWEDVVSLAEILLNYEPRHAKLWSCYGLALKNKNYTSLAEKAFLNAYLLDSTNYEIQLNLASIYVRNDKSIDAIKISEQLLSIKKTAGAYLNLGSAYIQLEQYDKAVEIFKNGIEAFSDNENLWGNLASAYHKIGKLQLANEANKRAVQINSGNQSIKFNWGLVKLHLGDYESGLNLVESRWESMSFKQLGIKLPTTPFSTWSGESIEGKRILIGAEQGLGDTIQFAQAVILLKKMNPAQITVVVQRPVYRIIKLALASIADVYVDGDRFVERYDYFVPMMSVLRMVGLRSKQLPIKVPFISLDQSQPNIIKSKLSVDKKKVGICWSGGEKLADTTRRNIDPVYFKSLVEINKNINFFSLQKEKKLYDSTEVFPTNYFNFMDSVDDFLDTAQLIACMDMVVTVDTSVAHLAGAMNVKTILLNRFGGEWRWGDRVQKSNWYPSVSIINQKEVGGWFSEFVELNEYLMS